METLSIKCQIDAFNGITNILRNDAKCILKMFCGTGKSRVIREVLLNQKKDLSVIVFPSLALIRQYTNDYLRTIQSQKSHKILNISSEILDEFTSTTDPSEIKKFLKLKKQKIICITYHSLETLISNLGNTIIGLACFDEAHRTTRDGVRELIYNSKKYEKQVFFTATPINQNGITMFERDEDEMGKYGDCGKLASEYTYLEGLRDGILSLFELRVDLYTEDTIEHMYESIARAILASGNQRVLTFHADTSENSSSDTSVLRFVDVKLFKKVYRDICEKEFPELIGKIKKISFTAITAETKNKDEILDKFDKCADDEIYIVSSCRTIGEGVDTKKANMCVFVDPKSLVNAIIQNIGRICRKVCDDEKPATVFIPVCINIDKYSECGEDSDKMDIVLREQLNDSKNGDFNAIMNVCVALKQEDPELFELCLKYTSHFTDSERMHSLNSQGCDLGEEVDYWDIDEMIENGECVEIHTSNMEEPIIYHNIENDDNNIKQFYMISGNDDEEPTYYEIIKKDMKNRGKLDAPSSKNRPYLNIHQNDEIKLSWSITNSIMNEKFGSAVINCCVNKLNSVGNWKLNYKKMCDFINIKGKAPSTHSKDPIEKTFACWVGTQKKNYDPKGVELSKHIMKNPEIFKIWTDTLSDEKYSKVLVLDLFQDWKNKHMKMCEFINIKNKIPSPTSKNLIEKKLGSWVCNQKTNYDPKGAELSKHIMKNPEIFKIWTDTLADEKYIEVLADPVQDWKNKHMKMCEFINIKGKAPSNSAKDPIEKTLACWVGHQKKNYDLKGEEFSKYIMKNSEIWKIWTDTLVDEKYSELLVLDPVQDWMNKYKKMCEFINILNKAPSTHSKDPIEKTLAIWIGHQKKNYDPQRAEFSKHIIKKSEIWKIWTNTLADEKYSKLLVLDPDQDWKNKHKKMCEFINIKGKSPSNSAKDSIEKTLAIWVGNQKSNYDPKGAEFSKYIMKNSEIWKIWTDTLADEKYIEVLVLDKAKYWKNKHKKMCEFINIKNKTPSSTAKDPTEKTLGRWVGTQKTNYTPKGAELSKHIMKNSEIWKIWTDTLANPKYKDFLNKFNENENENEIIESHPSKKQIVMKTHKYTLPSQSSIDNPKKLIVDSDYKLISRAWSIQNSKTTHQKLLEDPIEWYNYHDARDISFQGYMDQSQIPRNRVISYLEKKRKHRIPKILDLGCGRNNIEHHFTHINPNPKFTIIGYDHVAEQGVNSSVGNISDLSEQEPDETADICIYSQSLMGSDKIDYLDEGYRILRYNGEFVIADHIHIFDKVKEKLVELGCNIIKEEHDSNESKWFLLIAQKI
jgi:superfamily II DNA or RNA helicase